MDGEVRAAPAKGRASWMGLVQVQVQVVAVSDVDRGCHGTKDLLWSGAIEAKLEVVAGQDAVRKHSRN